MEDDSDSPIRHLEGQGLLLNVFNQLSSIVDLVVCSSVSKNWRALVKDAQPIALEVSCDTCGLLDSFGIAAVMQWLQNKQKQGRLQNVRSLKLSAEALFEEEYSEQMRLQASCFDAALMLSGLWNLRSCVLEGPVHLETAAAILPTTLRCLDITVYEPPEVTYLSLFERFSNLQLLYLQHSEGDQEGIPDVQFILDGSMPSLKTCHISTPFHCQLPSHVDDEHYVFDTFPNILQLQVLVMATTRGSRLANSFFHLKSLLHLEVCMLKGNVPWVVLVVPRSSSVCHLRLVGAPQTDTSLEIEKEKDFTFEARRVQNVLMPKPARTIPFLQFS